jgi:hypothetical protein
MLTFNGYLPVKEKLMNTEYEYNSSSHSGTSELNVRTYIHRRQPFQKPFFRIPGI